MLSIYNLATRSFEITTTLLILGDAKLGLLYAQQTTSVGLIIINAYYPTGLRQTQTLEIWYHSARQIWIIYRYAVAEAANGISLFLCITN